MFEHYAHVPKNPQQNRIYRRNIQSAAYSDPSVAEAVVQRCREDILFYINCFGLLQEPRKRKLIPFITYDFQDEVLKTIIRQIEGDGSDDYVPGDIPAFKSRDMGFTWMSLYVCDWYWRFHSHAHIGLVSKDLDSVDSHGAGSLMSKLDFLGSKLPKFLPATGDRYERLRNTHTLKNLETDSTIVGFAATGDVATGDRFFLMFMDEFHKFGQGDDYHALSSTQYVTDCRIIGSTVDPSKGPNGAFYDLVMNAKARESLLIEMHWSIDPRKKPGLYQSDVDGNVEILDPEYEFPPNYKFVADGKIRSPYYDREEARAPNKQSLACELDMSFESGSYQLFNPALIEKLVRGKDRTVRSPLHRGNLHFDEMTYRPEFEHRSRGLWELWCPLDAYDTPPDDTEYSIGADVAAGTGGEFSNYSAIVVFDKRSREQVAQYASNTIMPIPFARLLVAASKFFCDSNGNPAMIVPEINGPPGTTLFNELLRIEREGVYFNPFRDKRGTKGERKIGYYNADGADKILRKLEDDLKNGVVTLRSERLLTELLEYVTIKEKLIHRKSRNTMDETAMGKSHGDAAIAAAAGWMVVVDHRYTPIETKIHRRVHRSSIAYHMKMEEEAKQERQKWSVF